MCVVSMVGDHYRDTFPQKPYWDRVEPFIVPAPPPYYPNMPGTVPLTPKPSPAINIVGISRDEFEDLKRTVLEMKALLERAKKYDEEHDEPDCEIEDKVAFIKAVAKFAGVEIDVK